MKSKSYVPPVFATVMLAQLASAATPNEIARLPIPTQAILHKYPGLQVLSKDGGMRILYGAPMAAGNTAAEAAQRWINDDSAALAVPNLDLRLETFEVLDFSKNIVFRYQQFVDGLPVEYGQTTILVRNGKLNVVDYVGSRLAQPPGGGFPVDQIDGETAIAIIRAMPTYCQFDTWSAPSLVIYIGDTDDQRIPATRAWKFKGSLADRTQPPQSYTFFVDAALGRLLFARDEIIFDTPIHIDGLYSFAPLPDVTSRNPPRSGPLRHMQFYVGTDELWTDSNGNASSPTRPDPWWIPRSDILGRWVAIAPDPYLLYANVFDDGVSQHVVVNSQESEEGTAKVNAYVYVTLSHDFYKERAPSYTGLDVPITTYVNLPLFPGYRCNAFFDGTLNFFRAGAGCVNTAYSSVITHEYGHFIVSQRNLPQYAFGEGFSDSLAILIYNDPIVGRDIEGHDTFIRNISGSNEQYPCDCSECPTPGNCLSCRSGGIHECGKILAGVWWDIKQAMEAKYGSAAGLGRAQQLFVTWSRMTAGGSSTINSADSDTAVEVLRVNDDDSDLGNGTPDQDVICISFAKHNIDCPAGPPGSPTFPDCNHNGVSDYSELGRGTKPDCNTNRVLDECGEFDLATINFDSSYVGCQNGSEQYPYNSLLGAINGAPPGSRIILEPGDYLMNMTIAKPLSIECPGGRCRIGRPTTPVVLSFDLNGDGKLDLNDHEVMVACMTGPEGSETDPECFLADRDIDGDVDLEDYWEFQRIDIPRP